MISEYLIRFLFLLVSFNPTIGSEQLTRTREDLRRDLDHLNSVLDNLDELGDIMVLMLTTQDSIEVHPYSYPLLHNTNKIFSTQEKAEASLDALYHHLLTLEHLHERYVAYRMAFNKLILEIGRRRQYREAAENIVKGMMKQLESMTEGKSFLLVTYLTLISFVIEETRVRSHFNAEYGLHLPEDLCLCIGNSPTRWEVVPWEGSSLEVLPSIDADLIADVGVFFSSWSRLRLIYTLVGRLESGLVLLNPLLGRRACDMADHCKIPETINRNTF